MKKPEEKRIYVIVAGTIQVASDWFVHNGEKKPRLFSPPKTIIQPIGRQAAQACHAVTKLRFAGTPLALTEINHDAGTIEYRREFTPITTIILQARDSAELGHVFYLLFRKKLNPVMFSDNNSEYGPGSWPTAIAVFATPKQVKGALDYLPLWGSK